MNGNNPLTRLALARILLFVAGADLRGQATAAPGRTFEVASIKARGDDASAFPVCAGSQGLQITPGRLTANNTMLFNMVTRAYGIGYSCFIVSEQRLVSSGPKSILSDRFDVQATFPAGTPVYRAQQLQPGRAAEIQEMYARCSKTASIFPCIA